MSISRLYLDVIASNESFKDDAKFLNDLMTLARRMTAVKWTEPPDSVNWNKYIVGDGKKAIDKHIGICFEQTAALAHIWKNEIKSEIPITAVFGRQFNGDEYWGDHSDLIILKSPTEVYIAAPLDRKDRIRRYPSLDVLMKEELERRVISAANARLRNTLGFSQYMLKLKEQVKAMDIDHINIELSLYDPLDKTLYNKYTIDEFGNRIIKKYGLYKPTKDLSKVKIEGVETIIQ